MRFPGLQNKKFSAAAWLLLWSIGLRVIVYFLLPPAKEMEAYADTDRLFFYALTEHFSDYVMHITFIPPASYIINAAVLMGLGIKTALHIRAFVILVFLMHTGAVMLLYDAVKRTGCHNRYSFILLCIFSAILVPFALWRESMHYDVHTVFFAAFFAWALVRLITNKDSYLNMFWVSLSGGLLVAQSAVNTAIVPVTILCVVLVLYPPVKQFRKLGTAFVVMLILPITILFVISKKNKMVGEEALTSNKAGPAMMMVVQRAYNYDAEKIRAFSKEAGAPNWYLWTYDHATVTTDPATGKPFTGWLYLAQAFGICFFATGQSSNIYSFDFHPLLQYLRTDSESAGFIKSVEADSIDLAIKPYRFAGYSPELSPRWISVYGAVSQKIFVKALFANPGGMLKSFIVQQGIYSVYGPLFPFNVMKKQTNLLVRSGLRTLPGKIPLDPFFGFCSLLFAVIGWITYIICILIIPVVLILLFKKKNVINTDTPVRDFLLISIPVILNALVFSCLVGGENDRYFIQSSPYIILAAVLLPGAYRTVRNQFQ